MLQSQRYNEDFKRSFLTQGSTEDSCKSNVSKSWVFSFFYFNYPNSHCFKHWCEFI